MAADRLRDVYDRGIRLYNTGDIDRYAQEFTDDAVLTTPSSSVRGRAAIRDYWRRQREAFPDCNLTPESYVESRDKIATEWTWTGTNFGVVRLPDGSRLPPTGKRIELRGMEVARFRDGKISTYRVLWDGIALYGQLGVLPGRLRRTSPDG